MAHSQAAYSGIERKLEYKWCFVDVIVLYLLQVKAQCTFHVLWRISEKRVESIVVANASNATHKKLDGRECLQPGYLGCLKFESKPKQLFFSVFVCAPAHFHGIKVKKQHLMKIIHHYCNFIPLLVFEECFV